MSPAAALALYRAYLSSPYAERGRGGVPALAAEIDLGATTVYKAINGRRCSAATWDRLAPALGVADLREAYEGGR